MKTELQCIICGTSFLRKPSEIKRGRNKYCSKKCAIHTALANRNQTGENNPNWKGGQRRWKPTTEYLKVKQQQYRILQPLKRKAHQLISDAIRNGKLHKESCSQCSNKTAEAYHEDYNKPFEIIWLCKGCHMKLHADKNTGRFSDAIAKAEFSEVEPFPTGRVILNRSCVIDAVEITKIQRSKK